MAKLHKLIIFKDFNYKILCKPMNIFIHTVKFLILIKIALFCVVFWSYPSYPQGYPSNLKDGKVALLRD